jgi:copper chaperone CopZ
MKHESSSKAVAGVGIFAALASSLCCITPLLALLAGTSSMAANFYWIAPARPYLIVLSIVVLIFAWYQQLKPTVDDCDCEPLKKTGFLQTKSFLSIVTIGAIVMMTFPLYAKIFYPKLKVQALPVAVMNNKEQICFNIEGMTCEACEEHVNFELSKVKGVVDYATSYNNKNSVITFDKSIADIKRIEAAINSTGYKAVDYKILNTSK